MTAMLDSGRNDRLNTMLFVAALFHGVLILGITFTDGTPFSSAEPATSMDVVLLTREFEKRPETSDADYLAQQNLLGTGNTQDDAGLRVAYGRNADPVAPGPESDGADQLQQTESNNNSSEQRLYARTPEAGLLSAQQEQTQVAMQVRTGMPGQTNNIEILAAPDSETVLQGAKPRELIVSANTRESRIATYLDGWKRRIERVGTINFPRSVVGTGDRNPVLEVGILANGELRDAIILTSSGNRDLDMAAVEILQLAAPFDPFPEYLRSDYDSLKFSYEWRFNMGSVGRMTVPQ